MSSTTGDRADSPQHAGPGELPPPRLVEVSENIYAYHQPDGSWWINNTGFFVGERGVVSVDACATQRRTRAYLDAIASVTPLPVRTLLNTHHHGDHTFGNYLFEDATIIGQERCREEMLAFGAPFDAPFWEPIDFGQIRLAPPFVTFRDDLTVWVDDLKVEMRYVGTPAHTTNDSLVWVPDRSVLFTGDLLFNGGTPFLLMGSITGAIEVLETVVRPIPATTIVPGHGEVCGPELIDDVLGYLHFVLGTATDARGAGRTPLQAAREVDLGPYGELLDAERIVGNLHRAYAELSGAERGARIDVRAALADMVDYNGGRPLSCYA